MSLFSGMKLAGSSPDKSFSVTDNESSKKETETTATLGKGTGTLSNFSFIPDIHERQKKTDVAYASQTADVCYGSATNPDLCKDNPSGFLRSKVAGSSRDDELTFDLDPIKVTRDDELGGEKHHALDIDLQDLDFSVPLLSLDADKTLTEDDESVMVANLASKSSFSFITKEKVTHPCANEKPESGHSVSDVHSAQNVAELIEDRPFTSEDKLETASQSEDGEFILEQQFQGYVWNHIEKLGQIQKSIRELTSRISQVTEECILIGQDLVRKQDRLQALKQIQQQAIDSEDYEKAEELHIQCQDLETEISTASSPPPCNYPALRGHLAELELLYEQERATRQEIRERYQELIAEQKEAVATAQRRYSDVESSHSGKVQEERGNLDKDQRNLELDKECLHKQEHQLDYRIAESTADLRQARDLLITDRTQVQDEIRTLEAKLAAVRCQESVISNSIKEKDQEIEAATQEFYDERSAIMQERKLMEGAESNLRKRGEELDEEERRMTTRIAEAKEIMTSESKILLDLEESLREEKAAISDLTNRAANKLTNLWPEEASLENTKHLTKNDAAKQKLIEVQEATLQLVQSQTRLMTLRQKVSDVEGLIAALSEAKQLAVSGQNFPEAKRFTDEIKRLTSEGQHAQDEIEELSKSNEDVSRTVKMLRDDSQRLQEEATEKEKTIDGPKEITSAEELQRIVPQHAFLKTLCANFQYTVCNKDTNKKLSRKDKLLEYITILKGQLQDTKVRDPLVRTVQNGELKSSLLRVKFLCLKHQEPFPDNLEELVEDCLLTGDSHGETVKCYQITQEDNHVAQQLAVESSTEKLGTESENLETKLQETVEREDLHS